MVLEVFRNDVLNEINPRLKLVYYIITWLQIIISVGLAIIPIVFWAWIGESIYYRAKRKRMSQNVAFIAFQMFGIFGIVGGTIWYIYSIAIKDVATDLEVYGEE
jgi:hypothetical protein